MRSEVLGHFESTQLLKDMKDGEKSELLASLDTLQENCRQQLFTMHKAQNEGNLVMENSLLKSLVAQTNSLRSKIDLVAIENA